MTEFALIEFTLSEVREMLRSAMKTGKPPAREHLVDLMMATNAMVQLFVTTPHLREQIAGSDAVVSALDAHRQLVAARGAIDPATIEATYDACLNALRQIDPILADRESFVASVDDGLGPEEPRLAERLAFCCRSAFQPRDGDGAPSLTSDSAATRYAGIVLDELRGRGVLAKKDRPTNGSAVKQHILRRKKLLEVKWLQEASGTKA